MTYEECVNYIMNIPKFQGEPSTRELRQLLGSIVFDANFSKIIHVAGTNGKGSVCSYMANILKSAGYKVGLFISPHLVDIRERINYDFEMISKEDFVIHFEIVKNAFENSKKEFLTFFEYFFLIAMSYYSTKKPDYIILETGMGGRLDATNCVDSKALTIITEIGLDHVQVLGDTFEKIAYEKAGIIRKNTPLVFFDKREEVTRVIKEEFNRACGGEDILSISENDITITGNSENTLSFDLNIKDDTFENIQLTTKALYQCENASLAIAGCLLLNDLNITKEIIYKGLKSTKWAGRMELIEEGIYFDGAHNEDGIASMLESVATFSGKKMLLFAVVNDKNYAKMIEEICKSKIFENIVITSLDGSRTTDAEDILSIFEKNTTSYNTKITAIGKIDEAYDYCRNNREDMTLIVSGSLYLIGEIKEKFYTEKS